LSPVESKSTALTSLILLLSVGLVEDTQLWLEPPRPREILFFKYWCLDPSPRDSDSTHLILISSHHPEPQAVIKVTVVPSPDLHKHRQLENRCALSCKSPQILIQDTIRGAPNQFVSAYFGSQSVF
jgi:hypothetical protein